MCVQEIYVSRYMDFLCGAPCGIHLCHRVSMFYSVFMFYVGCVELMFFLQNTYTVMVISDIHKIQFVSEYAKLNPYINQGLYQYMCRSSLSYRQSTYIPRTLETILYNLPAYIIKLKDWIEFDWFWGTESSSPFAIRQQDRSGCYMNKCNKLSHFNVFSIAFRTSILLWHFSILYFMLKLKKNAMNTLQAILHWPKIAEGL